ncbi:MAG TPA: FxsA family protein [Desulfuromonadales bacterium]|nr:FxsA family protein [Desulfuromonadales bacterium]
MFIKIAAFIILIPLLEIFVLIKAGEVMGVFPTVAMIIATGIAGAYLARTQGFEVLKNIQRDLADGRVPADSLLDGALVLVGSVFLLTPGFCTDLLGFFLLIPAPRRIVKAVIRPKLQTMISEGRFSIRRF